MRLTRRNVLCGTVSLAALALGVGRLAAQGVVADRIFLGRIITMDDSQPVAEALAVAGGLIVAVGARDAVMALAGPDTVVTELGERALIPGFVDAHGHVTMGGLQALSANLLAPPDGEVVDIPSLQETLRAWIAANAEAVAATNLIIGFGYEPAEMVEKRHPTRQELDAVAADVPIVVVHQSGHILTANSAALAAGGVTAETPDPVGGVIRREADGETPNGVLEEMAMAPVLVTLLGQIGEAGGAPLSRRGRSSGRATAIPRGRKGGRCRVPMRFCRRWRQRASCPSTWRPMPMCWWTGSSSGRTGPGIM